MFYCRKFLVPIIIALEKKNANSNNFSAADAMAGAGRAHIFWPEPDSQIPI